MPELPEIAYLAKQLHEVLVMKNIKSIENYQEKSLNKTLDSFKKNIVSQSITEVTAKGKWIKILFSSDDYLAINLGMGGEIYFNQDHKKTNTKIIFQSDDYLVISFWWFGHVHFVSKGEHHIIDELGYDLIHEDISFQQFKDFILGNRGNIKNVLLDQRKIAGIGNYYVHDILFTTKIHPLKKANTITEKQLNKLYQVIIETFNEAINQHGSFYEEDIYGHKGSYKADLVAYKEDKPCPICKTTILKIKTSATTSYICPNCQR
ncbi:MAG: Fpg/Nei family DNA glycosylase [Candidatus Izemoplasmataceae bacterium]